jgi:hypothetical protein
MRTGKKKKSKYKENGYMPRAEERYAALNVRRQVGNRQELLDMDYIDKLSPEEKDFLNRALEEIIITNFAHKGEKLIKSKTKRRELYRENNARNTDLYANQKAQNKLSSLTSLENSSKNKNSNKIYSSPSDSRNGLNDTEDAMLSRIDLKQQGFIVEED